jgi:hypothetical protein
LLDAASKTNAADAIATLLMATGIPDLPCWLLCMRPLLLVLLRRSGELNTI